MRYYKSVNEYGRVSAVGIGLGYEEITEDEYNRLKSEMFAKADFADDLYWGKITIDSVRTEWREEVLKAVDARIAEYGTADEQELSDSDALDIILGGVV